jgi:hypothetical protein
MKKSKYIQLALVAASVSACSTKEQNPNNRQVYMRADSTAQYTEVSELLTEEGSSTSRVLPMYLVFKSYGYVKGYNYVRSGFYSHGLSESSNIGGNSTKSSIVRGGFGGRTMGASS